MGVLAFILVGCNGRPVAMETSDDGGTATNSDSGDTGTDTSADTCEGAALEYHGVCFFPHSVEAMGHDHPLDLDGEPGHELVGVDDGKVSVHKWNGDGFDLVGEADLPGEDEDAWSLNPNVVAGEFDEAQGLDLVVSEQGEWAALYHLDGSGAPTLSGTTMMQSPALSDRGFTSPVAVGPDDQGRWRVVAHRDDEVPELTDRLALWEVQGTLFVDERLDLPTDACELGSCTGGDLNADGRQDAVCTLMDYCSDPSPEEDIVHVVLLAQADGSVTTAAYPTKDVDTSAIEVDLDADGRVDLLGWTAGWYRLADGEGGLGPVVRIEKPEKMDTGWKVVSVGDVDGNAAGEVVLGDAGHALVFPDPVALPDSYETFQLGVDGLDFKNTGVAGPIDVNGDGVVDLPMRDRILLVSEVLP
jgi:hypothetical protein